MKNIAALDVFLHLGGERIPAGRLALSGNRIAWQYNKAMLQRDLPVSPLTFPLTTETRLLPETPRYSSKRGLPGFIADALPDYWGNQLLESALQRAGLININALDRLAWQGNRAVGALEFEPSLEVVDENTAWSYKQLVEKTRSVLSGKPDELAQPLRLAGGSAGGAYPKYAVAINADQDIVVGPAIPSGYRPVLLKVPCGGDTQNRIEHVYALMAKRAGIEVPPTQLIESEEGAWFAIDRFDRYGEQFMLKRHQVTLAGLLDRDFERESASAEEAILACKRLTNNQTDAIELFRRIVFNYLGHNCDDHAKNFSFHMNEKGEWRLAPWYDGAWCLNDGGHAMSLGGSRISGRRERFHALAKKIGFRQSDEIIGSVVNVLSGWRELAAVHNVPNEKIDQVSSNINSNISLLD